jgi:hypothetical protein
MEKPKYRSVPWPISWGAPNQRLSCRSNAVPTGGVSLVLGVAAAGLAGASAWALVKPSSPHHSHASKKAGPRQFMA